MALHLVTGYAGKAHITSADQGAFNSAIFGRENYVLNTGNCFSASAVTSNTVKVLDGEVIMQGRQIRLEPGDYEEVTIENGTQGYKRNDLVCIRYTKDSETGVEDSVFAVIKGTPDATLAVDPNYNEGNILDGILTVDLPLYRVPLDGLNVGEIVPLFETKKNLDERMSELETGKVDKKEGKGLSANDYSDAEKQQVADNKAAIENLINGTTSVANAKKAENADNATDADTVDGWHIYSRPSDLGFTSPLTMAELCAAMPNKSKLIWANNTNETNDQITDVPGTHGILTAVKRGEWCYATWIKINAQGKIPLWSGSWHAENGWTGWASYLLDTGGTVTGDIVIKKATGNPALRLERADGNTAGAIWKNGAQTVIGNWVDNSNAEAKMTTLVLSDINATLKNLLRLTNAGTVYQVLHTGFSAQVAITEDDSTAPEDTSALWIPKVVS